MNLYFLIDFSVSEGNQIKVVIDGDQGVTVNDCITISRAIEHNIDRDETRFFIRRFLGRCLRAAFDSASIFKKYWA